MYEFQDQFGNYYNFRINRDFKELKILEDDGQYEESNHMTSIFHNYYWKQV